MVVFSNPDLDLLQTSDVFLTSCHIHSKSSKAFVYQFSLIYIQSAGAVAIWMCSHSNLELYRIAPRQTKIERKVFRNETFLL